jgi:hypothetical protein
MQKRPFHLLLLLLALIFGPAANALAAPGHQPAGGSQSDSLHLTESKPFEKAGVVELRVVELSISLKASLLRKPEL